MDAAAQTIDRDKKGRFRPGCSGNPAGKKPGTRNRLTILTEALRDGEDTRVARIVIDKALAGDAIAARFVLERLEPKPRGRAIHLEIPEGESPAGEVVATFNAALRAMAAGEITPDEAVSVARFLEGRMRVLKAWQLEQKLTRWDNPLPIPGDDRPSPIPYPPRKPTQISSPPARGEKDAKGWRGEAEPYPKLVEGGAAARVAPDKSGVSPSIRAETPHPPPDSRPPRGPQAGEGKLDQAREGKMKAQLKSATHLHPPSISRPPQAPSIGWEQRVPPRPAQPTPRVVTRRPYP
jgi:hypothetical protein